MDPEVSERKMFRESAVREYLAGREGSVIPAFTGAKVTTSLWVLAALIVAGLAAFAHQVRVPAYEATAVLIAAESQETFILLPATGETDVPRDLLVTTDGEGVPERWLARRVVAELPAGEAVTRYNLPAGLLGGQSPERFSVVSAEREDSGPATGSVASGVYPALVASNERSVFDLLAGAM